MIGSSHPLQKIALQVLPVQSHHILGELSKIATRYGIIQEGRMVEQITAAELEQKCTDYAIMATRISKTAVTLRII